MCIGSNEKQRHNIQNKHLGGHSRSYVTLMSTVTNKLVDKGTEL